ncbi:MAG: hypothetical protein ABFE07_29475 [Armatimonadia bacterium]
MPEAAVKIEDPEALQKKMEELQKAEDTVFMKGYQDVSMPDLISRGYILHQAEITPGFTVKLRTLRKREELDVKRRVANYNGAQIYVVDELNVDALAFALVEINGVPQPDPVKEFDKAKANIVELPDALVVAILEEYRNLNKALVILVKGSSKNSLARHLLGRESA